jgi:ABC-2 type transport system ATP-binding protein
VDHAITLTGVSKSYGSTHALLDLTVGFPSGKLTGFLGPNGAGKTTTFRAVLGLTRPNAGRISVLGQLIPASLSGMVKRVGAVIEEPGLHKTLTGRDNLRVAAMTLGRGMDEIDALLDFVGLTEDAERSAGGYSKGMRQRLALAITMLGDPEILVLDEPLDGLDPAGQVSFKAKLRELVDERGKTVIVSSHDLADVESLADHVVVISHGRLRAEGSLEEVLGEGDGYRVEIADSAIALDALQQAGFDAALQDTGIKVNGAAGEEISRILAVTGLYPSALIPARNSLERVFLELTEGEDQ